jgi:hypothetical protein
VRKKDEDWREKLFPELIVRDSKSSLNRFLGSNGDLHPFPVAFYRIPSGRLKRII